MQVHIKHQNGKVDVVSLKHKASLKLSAGDVVSLIDAGEVQVVRKGHDAIVYAITGEQYVLQDFYASNAPDQAQVLNWVDGDGRTLDVTSLNPVLDVASDEVFNSVDMKGLSESIVWHIPQVNEGMGAVNLITHPIQFASSSSLSSEPIRADYSNQPVMLGNNSSIALIPSSSSTVAVVDHMVSGVVVAGPVVSGNDLYVYLYQADGQTLLGSAKVDAVGAYQIHAGTYLGVVVAIVGNSGTAPDYRDESTSAVKDLTAVLKAVGVVANDVTTLNINPLTTVAALQASASAGSSVLTSVLVEQTNLSTGHVFGIANLISGDIISVVNSDGSANPLFAATQDGTEAKVYGLVLAAMSGVDVVNGGDSQATISSLVSAFINDGSTLSDSGKAMIINGVYAVDASLVGQVVSAIEPTASTTASGLGSDISGADVSTLSSAVIASLSSAQLATLTALQIDALSAAQITALGADISSLSDTALASLDATQMAAIAASSLATLTNTQLGNLSATQVGGLTALQIDALSAAQITALGADISSLSDTALASLDAAQVAALTSAQTILLTGGQLNAIADNGLWGSLAYAASVDIAQIQSMGLTVVDTTAEANLLQDMLNHLPVSQTNTLIERQALVDAAQRLMNTAAGATPSVTMADLKLLGVLINGVVDPTTLSPENQASLLAALVATDDSGINVDSIAKVQAVADAAVDTTAPSLTVTDNTSGTATGAVTYTFTFSEAVTGFDAADITLSAGTKGTFTTVTTSKYTLSVSPPVGTGTYTLDVAAAAATDLAGNNSTAAAQNSQVYDIVPVSSYTLSGTLNGINYTGWKLIAPATVNVSGTSKTFYYLDASGDGTSANSGSYNGGVDYMTHDTLDTLLNNGTNTTDSLRSATLNLSGGGTISVMLATGPTSGLGGYLADNQTYTNDLAEIWDTYNSGYQTVGTPTGWRTAGYWSATPSASGHATVTLSAGHVDDFIDTNLNFVAFQVL